MNKTNANTQCDAKQATCAVTPPISAKGAASVLRDIADRLEAAAADLPRTAREVIGRFSPKDSLCECRQTIDLRYVGRSNFNPLKILRSEMARNIGHFIAEKQEFTLVREDDCFVPGSMMYPGALGPSPFSEAYRARLHVFTPGQLQALVERAIEAGKASR